MKQNALRDILAALRSGQPDAFDRLYDMLSKPVYTIAYRITGQREQAEDLTQEIFLRLYLSPPDASVKNPRAWIFQMVHNLAIDTLRKLPDAPLPDALADPADPIGDALLRAELAEAMTALTPQEREIVALHIDAELPFHEIAALTGGSLSSVYRSYRRALRTLREALEPPEKGA